MRWRLMAQPFIFLLQLCVDSKQCNWGPSRRGFIAYMMRYRPGANLVSKFLCSQRLVCTDIWKQGLVTIETLDGRRYLRKPERTDLHARSMQSVRFNMQYRFCVGCRDGIVRYLDSWSHHGSPVSIDAWTHEFKKKATVKITSTFNTCYPNTYIKFIVLFFFRITMSWAMPVGRGEGRGGEGCDGCVHIAHRLQRSTLCWPTIW